jgi:hypothetical protein
MHYRCSSCSKPIGAMFDAKGKAELFKCPHSGRISHCVPNHRPEPRKTPPLPKWLRGDDLSQIARRAL